MTTIAVFRHSTNKQDEAQQKNTVEKYMAEKGIIADHSVVEQVSGSVSYKERLLGDLFLQSKSGDVFLLSEFTRLSRDVSDSFLMLAEIKERGLIVHLVKENLTIDGLNFEPLQYMQVFMSAFAAEAELTNIKSRVSSAMEVCKTELNENGFFISKKTGRKITKLGNTANLADAQKLGREANSRKRKLACQNDMQAKRLYYATLALKDGRSNKEIIKELIEMGYTTPTGGVLVTQNVSRIIKRGLELWG